MLAEEIRADQIKRVADLQAGEREGEREWPARTNTQLFYLT